MRSLKLSKAFTLLEPGPVVLVTTCDKEKYNIIVKAPLIKQCVANIECKVTDIIKKHNILVLEGLAAYTDSRREEKRTVHAVGDGSFVVDGQMVDRRRMMAAKIPRGV